MYSERIASRRSSDTLAVFAAGRELIIVFASRLSPGDFLFFTLIATLSNTHKIRLKR
jgi:hypothetical protein